MKLTADHYRVLAALRGATALRREPGPLTPDGTERWFSLAELDDEGRLDIITLPAAAARSLHGAGLVSRRTQFTVTRYAITEGGMMKLAIYEDEHGLTETAAAELELRQAREDHRQAWKRIAAAQARLSELQLKAGARS